MNLNFIKYVSVLLDSGPEIKDQIQENYDFLVDIYTRMTSEKEVKATSATSTDQVPALVVGMFPSVAAVCVRCEPARVASGTARVPNGFFTDLIEGFDLDGIQRAIELIVAIAQLFGVDLDISKPTATADEVEEQQTGE